MKKIFIYSLVVVITLTVISLSSCKNRSASKIQKEKERQEIEAMEKKIEENVYPLPTSAEVIKKLTYMDLGYILGATNLPENVSRYVTSYSRSVNVGIYGADLSYVTLYNLQQSVIDYLAAIRSLTLEQNLSKIYDETLYDRIKANFDDRDSLVTILTNAFDRTYSYMVDAGEANLGLLMVGGAWVEGVYLTLAVSESGSHLSGFEAALLDQKKAFELFEELTTPYADDAMVSKMLKELEPLREVYASLGTSLTFDQIEVIKEAVNKVRPKLIQ